MLLFKNLKRRLQGKELIVNTTGQTREEIEDEEDTAPKAINLDASPPPPPTTDEIADDLIQNAMTQHATTQHTPRPRPKVAHRSRSNPSGPVQSKTSYDKDALIRLASELENMGRGCDPDIVKELRSRENQITSDVIGSLGHQKVATADVVIVAAKTTGSLSGPPMVLKNRLAMNSGFEIGMAGNLIHDIAQEHAPVEIEVIRDPTRTIYLIDLDGDRDKAWADMKAQQDAGVQVEKYVLVKGIPNCSVGRSNAESYPKPIVSIIRGHAHNSPVGPAEILAQVWADGEDAILSIKIRKGDLPLPLTVEVNADHEGIMGGDGLTFLRQGTFPDDDKVSRVVVDLNQKGSAGKQPAIDEEFVGQINKAMDDWDGMDMEDVDLSGHAISISAAGMPVFSSAMPASVISSFQSATDIPNTRSKITDQKIQPGAMMSASVIKSYTSERSLEISEVVTREALAKSKQKIRDLERKVKRLETKATRDSNKKHKAKSSYVSRARGGTTGE